MIWSSFAAENISLKCAQLASCCKQHQFPVYVLMPLWGLAETTVSNRIWLVCLVKLNKQDLQPYKHIAGIVESKMIVLSVDCYQWLCNKIHKLVSRRIWIFWYYIIKYFRNLIWKCEFCDPNFLFGFGG